MSVKESKGTTRLLTVVGSLLDTSMGTMFLQHKNMGMVAWLVFNMGMFVFPNQTVSTNSKHKSMVMFSLSML